MTEEHFFSDPAIVEQSSAAIKDESGTTNGISLMVESGCGSRIEILLEYGELKAAIADLEADREALPHLYTR